MKIMAYWKSLGTYVLLALMLTQNGFALDLAGVTIPEVVRVNNQDLKLNGAGIRYKALFKVYTAALYLPEKKNTVSDVLTSAGPRRIELVMLRDLSSEDFSRAFMHGIQNNSDKVEKTKIIKQLLEFGEMFAAIPELKKGDVLILDWIPGTGTQADLNGKLVYETLSDQTFYNVLLKIWLGEKPVDRKLKSQMLGEPG